MRFWLYQKPDGKIATVFDACEICGPVGFYKGRNRRRLQELCCAHQSAIGGNAGRLQSNSAIEPKSHSDCGHHSGNRRGGRAPTCSNRNNMFVRLLYESFRRQKRRKLLAGVAITWAWAWRQP